MTSKRRAELGMLLLTTAGLGIGAVSTKNEINKMHFFHDLLYTYLLAFSLLAILVGGIILMQLKVGYKKTFLNYEREFAQFSDLPDLHEMCCRYFGDGVIDIELMNELYSKNSKVFIKIVEIKTKGLSSSKSIVGFFDILPINGDTAARIEVDHRNAGSILVRNVLGPEITPEAVYIGGIFAKGFRAKAVTLAFLKSTIEDYLKSNVKKIFARPTTADGLRLIEAYNFIPLTISKERINILHLKKIE